MFPMSLKTSTLELYNQDSHRNNRKTFDQRKQTRPLPLDKSKLKVNVFGKEHSPQRSIDSKRNTSPSLIKSSIVTDNAQQ